MKKKVKALMNRARLSKNGNSILSYDTLDLASKIDHSKLSDHAMVAAGASISHSSLGRLTSVGRNTKIVHAEIGSFCAISWDTTINAIAHPLEHATICAFPYVPEVGGFVRKRKQQHQLVKVGNDVWIGAHVVIMPGVNIGNGAVIGAGSIVTKDVDDYSIVVGNPARHVRYRFSESIIDKLKNLEWWNWDNEKIKRNLDFFSGEIIESDFETKIND